MAKKISKKQRQARREQRQEKWQKKTSPMVSSHVDYNKVALVAELGYEVYEVVYQNGNEIRVTGHGIMKGAKEESAKAYIRKHTPTDGPIIALRLSDISQEPELADFFNDYRVLECTEFALMMMASSGEDIRLMEFEEYKAKFEQAAESVA